MGLDIESTIANAVTGGIGGIVSQGLGILGNDIFGQSTADKEQQQLQQQQALAQQQLQDNEQLTDYNRQSQLEYQQAQPLAQVQGYEAAGLNPALMYGGGGSGGTTGGGVVTFSPPQASDVSSMTQAETAQAQQANNAVQQTAQTNQSNAQADNLVQSTALLGQQTNNTKIAGLGLVLDNELKDVQVQIAQGTEDAQEAIITQTLDNLTITKQKLEAELYGQSIHNTTDLSSQKAVIQSYNLKIQEMLSSILLNNSQAKLNQAQADSLAQRIQQGWQDLALQAKGQQISIQNVNTMTKAMLAGAGIQAVGNLINTVVGASMKTEPSQPQGTTTNWWRNKQGTEGGSDTWKH